MEKGKIIVLSGASSVGKSEIRKKLMEDPDLKLFYSISITTRPRKEHEVDGVDYYFVDHKSFANAIRNKELLEYTEFNGYYYGTPIKTVELLVNIGKNVLIETEAQGVGQIKLLEKDAIAFFIMPASFEDLEDQIRERYKDDIASIKNRLAKAKVEMELAPLFRNCIDNQDNEKAYQKIKEIILNEHS